MGNGTNHTIKDGESAESVAASHGLPVRRVWDAAENATLRKARDDVPDILNPGDNLFVPTPDPKILERDTDKRHTFKVFYPKSKLRLQILKYGELRQNIPYVLIVDGHEIKRDQTDANGLIEAEISAIAKSATVKLGTDQDRIVYHLHLRGVHPVSEPLGWQARLSNLGYPIGKLHKEATRTSLASLCAFHDHQRLKVDGEPDKDQPAREKLKFRHGC
jgi:hypothetical protein